MINKKSIYIAAAIILVAIAGFFISRMIFSGGFGQAGGGRDSSSPTAESNTYEISKLVNTPQEDTLLIGTAGGAVNVKNFYKTAVGAEEQFVIMKTTENFKINYDTYTSGFSVYISAAPFDVNRRAVEKTLLDILEISETDACKLKVFESVPPSVDKNLAGRNLGLSFCAGGV